MGRMRRALLVRNLAVVLGFVVVCGWYWALRNPVSASAFGGFIGGVGTMVGGIGAVYAGYKLLTQFQSERQKVAIEIMVSAQYFAEILPAILSPAIFSGEMKSEDGKKKTFAEIVNARKYENRERIQAFLSSTIKAHVMFGHHVGSKCDELYEELAKRQQAIGMQEVVQNYDDPKPALKYWEKSQLSSRDRLEIHKRLLDFHNALRREIGEEALPPRPDLDEKLNKLVAEEQLRLEKDKHGESE
jgi:hypothetical protein